MTDNLALPYWRQTVRRMERERETLQQRLEQVIDEREAARKEYEQTRATLQTTIDNVALLVKERDEARALLTKWLVEYRVGDDPILDDLVEETRAALGEGDE